MDVRSSQELVHRLSFDVKWPPGHVACYLIEGPEPILVDAAAPGRTEAFRDALATYGYGPGDIEHLLVTHPHVDHIGEVPTVLEASDPTVYAPVGVKSRFDRPADTLEARVRRNCREAGFSGETLETAVGRAVESLERNLELLAPGSVDVWIEPGERLSVGSLDVEGVHLPGHQADHLSYRTDIDGDRVLLAGDMGIEPFRPIVLHEGLDDGYRDAFSAFYGALDRMAELEVDVVYPGHGPVHGDLDWVVDRDRSSLDNRLDQVAALVADGHETTPAVAEAVAGDHGSQYLLPEAMGALAHLEKTGRVTGESRAGVRRYSR
ncbi:MBL fold metallo-hydrolase [Natronomonas sp. F2-12]|jgi:glyoxylase-like metal-dependent hydrolase (beta-lactamase superfamily II)|uniref:MBL fold metallo-hydrolase n=1 Tax=Natronomonas aquatica TaxID=2841590 RepID=A0A9R1CUP3_9EURY|nr:MBL fold metallo-hydrolase [Natronomonas aquatica]MCQ4334395.1 MBL fold metallo-hydrolase [Natronomonas aquatica]